MFVFFPFVGLSEPNENKIAEYLLFYNASCRSRKVERAELCPLWNDAPPPPPPLLTYPPPSPTPLPHPLLSGVNNACFLCLVNLIIPRHVN